MLFLYLCHDVAALDIAPRQDGPDDGLCVEIPDPCGLGEYADQRLGAGSLNIWSKVCCKK